MRPITLTPGQTPPLEGMPVYPIKNRQCGLISLSVSNTFDGFSRALGGLPVKGLSRTTRIQLIGKSLAVYRLQNRLQHPGGECREKRTYNRMLTKRAISSGVPAKNQFSSTFLKVRRSRSILAAGTIR